MPPVLNESGTGLRALVVADGLKVTSAVDESLQRLERAMSGFLENVDPAVMARWNSQLVPFLRQALLSFTGERMALSLNQLADVLGTLDLRHGTLASGLDRAPMLQDVLLLVDRLGPLLQMRAEQGEAPGHLSIDALKWSLGIASPVVGMPELIDACFPKALRDEGLRELLTMRAVLLRDLGRQAEIFDWSWTRRPVPDGVTMNSVVLLDVTSLGAECFSRDPILLPNMLSRLTGATVSKALVGSLKQLDEQLGKVLDANDPSSAATWRSSLVALLAVTWRDLPEDRRLEQVNQLIRSLSQLQLDGERLATLLGRQVEVDDVLAIVECTAPLLGFSVASPRTAKLSSSEAMRVVLGMDASVTAMRELMESLLPAPLCNPPLVTPWVMRAAWLQQLGRTHEIFAPELISRHAGKPVAELMQELRAQVEALAKEAQGHVGKTSSSLLAWLTGRPVADAVAARLVQLDREVAEMLAQAPADLRAPWQPGFVAFLHDNVASLDEDAQLAWLDAHPVEQLLVASFNTPARVAWLRAKLDDPGWLISLKRIVGSESAPSTVGPMFEGWLLPYLVPVLSPAQCDEIGEVLAAAQGQDDRMRQADVFAVASVLNDMVWLGKKPDNMIKTFAGYVRDDLQRDALLLEEPAQASNDDLFNGGNLWFNCVYLSQSVMALLGAAVLPEPNINQVLTELAKPELGGVERIRMEGLRRGVLQLSNSVMAGKSLVGDRGLAQAGAAAQHARDRVKVLGSQGVGPSDDAYIQARGASRIAQASLKLYQVRAQMVIDSLRPDIPLVTLPQMHWNDLVKAVGNYKKALDTASNFRFGAQNMANFDAYRPHGP